jgi:hypothetical protein
MFNQKSVLVLFIDRLGIQLFGGTLQSIVSLQIPETIVKDWEVISKDGLYTLIKQWVKQYSLSGSRSFVSLNQSIVKNNFL